MRRCWRWQWLFGTTMRLVFEFKRIYIYVRIEVYIRRRLQIIRYIICNNRSQNRRFLYLCGQTRKVAIANNSIR